MSWNLIKTVLNTLYSYYYIQIQYEYLHTEGTVRWTGTEQRLNVTELKVFRSS